VNDILDNEEKSKAMTYRKVTDAAVGGDDMQT